MKKSGKYKLTYLYIVMQNLRVRLSRTLLLSSFIFILVLSIYICTGTLQSLEKGVDSTRDRIGADIILVPEDYVSSYKEALFLGEPCTMYFEKDWMDTVSKIEGIEQISSQMYLSTLTDSACCDNVVQIVAYNPITDFTVLPWIKEGKTKEPKGNQIIIGSNLAYKPGDTAIFYGEEFMVMEKLQETGMGYDNCIFLNYDTAFELVKKPIIRNYFAIGDREDMISLVQIKVADTVDVESVAEYIESNYGDKGIIVYTSSKLVKGIVDNIEEFSTYSFIIRIVIVLLAFFSLLAIFTITINERKREYGILRCQGATRGHIFKLVAGEAAIISLLGSVSGVLTAYVLLRLFKNFILNTIKLPYLQLDFYSSLNLASACILLSLITGLGAATLGALKISKAEAYELIRENE